MLCYNVFLSRDTRKQGRWSRSLPRFSGYRIRTYRGLPTTNLDSVYQRRHPRRVMFRAVRFRATVNRLIAPGSELWFPQTAVAAAS
jgi:hypothetical protein